MHLLAMRQRSRAQELSPNTKATNLPNSTRGAEHVEWRKVAREWRSVAGLLVKTGPYCATRRQRGLSGYGHARRVNGSGIAHSASRRGLHRAGRWRLAWSRSAPRAHAQRNGGCATGNRRRFAAVDAYPPFLAAGPRLARRGRPCPARARRRAPPTHLRVRSEGESAPGDALLRDDHRSDAIRPTSMTARRATFGRP